MFMNELQDLVKRSDRIVIDRDCFLVRHYMRNEVNEWIDKQTHETFSNHKMTALIDFLLTDDDLEFNFFKIDWNAFNIEIIHRIKPYKEKACI